MDSRWVLTTEQKKVRFRNYLKKKETPLGVATSPDDAQELVDQRPLQARMWINDPYLTPRMPRATSEVKITFFDILYCVILIITQV